MIGTDRAPLSMDAGNEFEILLQRYDIQSDEQRLLLGAAMLTILQKVGTNTSRMELNMPPPAPDDDRPIICEQATQHLEMMLSEFIRGPLEEWLAAVHTKNYRLPDEILPRVLDYGTRVIPHRAAILRVAGERAYWLYRHYPAFRRRWKWIREYMEQENTVIEDHLMETDEDGLRENALRHLRQIDPAKAREILQSHWDNTIPRRQRQLLSSLEVNLSLADEEWLQQTLEDAEIRDFSARLMAQLPESAFSRMVHSQVIHFVEMRTHPDDGTQQMAFVWTGRTEAEQEEIIRQHEADWFTVCGKIWLPRKLVSYVPPAFWCGHFQISLLELVDAVRQGADANTFLDSLAWAASTHQDAQCAYHLLCEAKPGDIGDFLRRRLVDILSAQQCEDVALHWLTRMEDSFYISHPAIQMLQSLPAIWSAELTHKFLQVMRDTFDETLEPLKRQILCSLMQLFAAKFDIEQKDPVFEMLTDIQRYVETSDLRMLDTVRAVMIFRQQMLITLEA